MNRLIPSEPFQDIYNDRYVLDFKDFWDNYFYYNLDSKYKRYFNLQAINADLLKANIFDFFKVLPGTPRDTKSVYAYTVMKELFIQGALIQDPFKSHGENIDFSKLNNVSTQYIVLYNICRIGISSTTTYSLYKYFDYFTEILIYNSKETEKARQHNQIGKIYIYIYII